MMSALQAQLVEEGEAALVYYSPKTTVSLDFTYTVETQERGMYAAFAEAMLGAEQVIPADQQVYTITDVRINTATQADLSRPHKVSAEAGIPLLLNINEKGILKGYNLPFEEHKPATQPKKNAEVKEQALRVAIPPYSEDVLMAATRLAQAKAIAKQIFRLRETRTYLLNGEVEHAPADGQAMKQVLAELDKHERELTELFVGKKSIRTEHKIVRFDPEEKEPVWFFSKEHGFTEAPAHADTLRVHVALHPQHVQLPGDTKKKKKKGAELSPIVYNLPGTGEIEVSVKGRTLAQRTIPIAQIGIDVPLAKDLFTAEQLPVIVFNEKTGNVVSISK